jgi:hypothetical protein
LEFKQACMEIVIRRTALFEKDLKKFSSSEKAKVDQYIQRTAELFANDKEAFYRRVYRPAIPVLKRGFESSLYVIRAGTDIRVILAADDDPLFDQTIVTLLSVTRHDGIGRAFERVARLLYSDQLEALASTRTWRRS